MFLIKCDQGVRIREYQESDVTALFALSSDPKKREDIAKWIPHFPRDYETAKQWVDARLEGGRREYIIEVHGAVAGGSGYVAIEGQPPHVSKIGYWLDPAFQHRGIATRVVRAMALEAPSQGIRMLQGAIRHDNERSANVLTRAGFRCTYRSTSADKLSQFQLDLNR